MFPQRLYGIVLVISVFFVVAVVGVEDDLEGTCLLQRHAAVVTGHSTSKLSNSDATRGGAFPKSLLETPPTTREGAAIVMKFFMNAFDAIVDFVQKHDLFFRPVSSSVRACIWIIVMNLLIMTALVIIVNRNEALTEPHVYLLSLFKALKRISAIGPSFALFLIAARMHLNGSTNNLGSFPLWVTICIYLIPTGIFLQYVLVWLVSLAVEWDDTLFETKLGWPSMVHPWLHKLKYGSDSTRRFFMLFQIVVMLLIYASAIGVVVGMFQVAIPSPSIMCALLLTLLFCLVSASNWMTNQGQDVSEEVIQFFHGMAHSVGMYQKTSMATLIMLTDRQRAMFLDPPNGKPQPWAQDVFWTITAVIYLHVLLSGLIGRVGKRKAGHFGASYYAAHPSLHGVKLLLSLVFVGLVTAIVVSIYTLPQNPGDYHVLSPTVLCVLVLAYIYFGVWEVLEYVNFCRYILGWTERTETMKFALEACASNMAISPLIGAICVAARMRALQISDGVASPQRWAQESMYAAVCAVILYTVCGVLIPVFKGGVENADATGNVNVDLKPLMGAFLVQTAKYFALIAIYASVFAICASVFLITPKTADYGTTKISIGGIIKDVGIGVLVFVVALLLSSAKVIGLIVKFAVEEIEVHHCCMSMDKAVLSVARGYVSCAGVVVHHPQYEGAKFTSPYTMRTDLMIVHIDVWRLITSGFKEISVIKLVLSGVHVYLEKSSYSSCSNIQIILKGTPEEQAAAKANEGQCVSLQSIKAFAKSRCKSPDSSQSTAQPEAEKSKETAPAEKSHRQLFLGLVQIDNISASIVKTPVTLFDAEVGDLKLEDIKPGDIPVEEIASTVIETILKTLSANTAVLKKLGETLLVDMCSPQKSPKPESEALD